MNHRALPWGVLVVALLAPVISTADGRNVLWTVDGKSNTIYLMGSLHVLRPKDGPLPAVADAAYADAEQLIMEIDMDDALADPATVVQAMQVEAMLPRSRVCARCLARTTPVSPNRFAQPDSTYHCSIGSRHGSLRSR